MRTAIRVMLAIVTVMALGTTALAEPLMALGGADQGSQVAAVIQRLKRAELADRGNAMSYNDSPSLGLFYARKAAAVATVIDRLEQGEKVPAMEIAAALDNSGAEAY